MDREERRQFVRDHRTCIFGYNRKNDGPAMTVVYYVMDGDTLLVSTMAGRAKAKAVQRDPLVSLCVLDENWPFTYLQVYGRAVLDPDPDQASQLMRKVVWTGRAAAGQAGLGSVVQVGLPVGGDAVLGAGGGLVQRVVVRRGQFRAPLVQPVVGVAPEPGFLGLEALDDRVPGLLGVGAGVLGRRGVAAADVAALGAAAQVEPPAAGRVALGAAGPAGGHRRVDAGDVTHVVSCF
jgi:PPOX class probable F420-dependent enzyme